MVLVTSNKLKQLLFVSYIGVVSPQDLKQGRADMPPLLAEMKPGFSLLVDLSQLTSMGLDCVDELGRNMELFDQHGVGVVVRVIPDPYKDIGMNILTIFHYAHRPRVVTCDNMTEGVSAVLA